MRHKDENEESLITFGTEGSELDSDLKSYADYVIEKSTPSAFFKTNLDEILQSLGVNHIFVTGFNTEYCPQFTAIAAYDRGFQVTFIEDATATVDRKSTRLNSSHVAISYAVFCLKKKIIHMEVITNINTV